MAKLNTPVPNLLRLSTYWFSDNCANDFFRHLTKRGFFLLHVFYYKVSALRLTTYTAHDTSARKGCAAVLKLRRGAFNGQRRKIYFKQQKLILSRVVFFRQ